MPARTFAVPYRLGFDVRYAAEPVWSVRRDVYIGIDGVEDWADDAFAEYDASITTLYMLGETGALSGSAIEPWTSRFAQRSLYSRSAARLTFVLRETRTDELTTILCANTLSLGHDRYPIRRLAIAMDPSLATAQLQLPFDIKRIDPYPSVFARTPFNYTIEDDLASPQVRVVFARDDLRVAPARDQILAWAAAVSSGMYAAVLAPPIACHVAFDPHEIDLDGDELTFSISQLECHEAALRGLINACAVLHHDVCPIISVTID